MFTVTVQPRFGDTDCLGHINNTVLAVWFEQARTPFFRFFCPDLEIRAETWPLIMAHTDYDFRAEMRFKYPVEITSAVSRVGTKSFTVYHEARQNGHLCATGHAIVVYYDFNTRQTVPIPEDKKRLLMEHFESEPGRGQIADKNS